MENRKMKKPIPAELNEEELNMAAGGADIFPSLPQNGYDGSARIPCAVCGKLVYPTEVVYTFYGDPFCRDCYESIAAAK